MKKIPESAANQYSKMAKLISNNKGQSMPMNVIIVAVLALIVLVVILFIFNDKINIFGKGISDCKGMCETKLGDVVSSSCKTAGYTYNPAGICSGADKGKVCCIKVYQEETQS